MFDLYAITDKKWLGSISESEAAKQCFKGGADILQLRMKNEPRSKILETAKAIQDLAQEHNKFFIVNDDVNIAIEQGADGVHLGLNDMPVAEARKICDDSMIIGASVHNASQARKAVDQGADYVAVGSIFQTSTKSDAEFVGLDGLVDVKNEIQNEVPIIAIGGINRGNLEHVLSAGADCIAVSSAIMGQKDIRAATKELKTMIINWKRIHGRLTS